MEVHRDYLRYKEFGERIESECIKATKSMRMISIC